jgi:4-amino-4-deoxy-L-arabinose transferase-like glycosyltransferase
MSDSRRCVYPLLLALPFLIGIAVLQGLTVEIDTFHGSDAGVYHLPTILQFSERLDFEHYPAAQTPLYHLLFAGYGKLVGFELWKLRLLNVALSYAAILAIYRLLLRRLERVQAFALALLIALSPYVLGPSFTLLTDNLALLFGVLALGCFERARGGSLTSFALGCLGMAAAVLTRQSFLWLVLVAAWALLRGPFSPRQRLLSAAVAAGALAPFAALVAVWGGLVPPGSDPASCGLCTDRPGVGRDALTLRTVGFTVAVFGLYAAVVYGPVLARRVRTLSPRPIAAALAAGGLLVVVSPLAYVPPVPGQPGDAGYLWKAADRLPELASTSLLFWLLVPLGAVALSALVARARLDSLPTVWLGAFLIAALPVRLVYQKYFDPFALLALALFARPPDLRRPLDYAGIAVLGAAFVAYALAGGG